MSEFEVGDYVEIHSSVDPDRYNGRRGTITKLPSSSGGLFEIKEENGRNLYFPTRKLKKVEKVEESERVFQVGDVVKVHDHGPFWDGAVGRITDIQTGLVVISIAQDHKTPYGSTVDAGTGGFGFYPHQVTLVEPTPEPVTLHTTALEEYKRKVLKVALEVKESEKWCDSGFKEAMKELEIPWSDIWDAEIGDIYRDATGRLATLSKGYWVVGGQTYDTLRGMLVATNTIDSDWLSFE